MEEAGYLEKKGNAWELTPRGNRRIGEKALAEIYANLKRQNFGKHNVPETGRYGDRADDTKLYEFGDPFHLNLKETISNAILRTAPEGGPQVPVNLTPDDFEVYRSETLTQTATVVMLDLSWSMALRGSFQAAKKVAMALNNLIRMQYPRDSLYLIGFSAYARELKADQLPYVRWDETVLGTNMHHALLIAQQLLAKHKVGDPPDHHDHRRRTDRSPRAGTFLLRLPAVADHDSRDAQRGPSLHQEGHCHQCLHARSQLLPEGVRRPRGADQRRTRLLQPAPDELGGIRAARLRHPSSQDAVALIADRFRGHLVRAAPTLRTGPGPGRAT